MSKPRPFHPAAVYAPDLPGAQAARLPILTARRLFILDDRTELLADLTLPVADRPVLTLHMLHASMGGEYGAQAFVTDALATIGDTEAEQVAVVGTLLQVGCRVIVGEHELNGAWYQPRVRRLGYSAVGPVIDSLLDFRAHDRLWREWPTAKTHGALTVLPTSLKLGYADARLRVKELIEFREHGRLTVAQVGDRLAAEGHPNAEGRRLWYPKAVREALEQGL